MENVSIIAWVLATFALLKSVSTFLNFLSKKTANKSDDAIAGYLSTGLGYGSKLLDLVTANTRPK